MTKCHACQSLITLYLAGETTTAAEGALHAHLASCGACREAFEEEAALGAFLQTRAVRARAMGIVPPWRPAGLALVPATPSGSLTRLQLAGLLAALGTLAVLFASAIGWNLPGASAIPAAEAIGSVPIHQQLVVPDGYDVSLFATGVADARTLRVTSAGDVIVSSPFSGRVMLLEADRDGDGASDGARTLLAGLIRPNGLDIAGDYLYIAEEHAVGRVKFDASTGTVVGGYERVIDGLPAGGSNWKKTIRFGPDGLLYVSVGSSCNACVEEDARRASLLRFTPEGTFVDRYATGLRNSVGFDWSPSTGILYATDNGRDLLGEDFPPCELNAVVEDGFYGWPFAHGANVPDPDLAGRDHPALEMAIKPAHEFRPHNAPLGMVFLRHEAHPPEYRDAAVVALHGSWERSQKDGYKVVSLHFGPDGSIEERDLLTGFLANNQALGRPAEVAEGPDGSIYVSDDFASAVYRIRYGA